MRILNVSVPKSLSQDSEFLVGDQVCVKQSWPGRPPSMWRRPHLPIPGKLEALPGTVVRKLGMRSDPSWAPFFTFAQDLGLSGLTSDEACYLVEFQMSPEQQKVFGVESSESPSGTQRIHVEVFQSWLQSEARAELKHF